MDVCNCTEPGFCMTFGRTMTGSRYEICQGRRLTHERQLDYRRLWKSQGMMLGYDPPFSCDLRGSTTGTVGCQTCKNQAVQIPVHECPLHGKAILAATNDEAAIEFAEALKRGETPSVWQCNLCKERTTLAVKRLADRRIGPEGLLPSEFQFNNSCIEYAGARLMAYRLRWDDARVVIAELDGNWQPVRNRQLDLKCGLAQEDPRLFIHRGRLHVAYTAVRYEPDSKGGKWHMVTDVAYARLAKTADGWAVAEDFYPHYPQRSFWEKNWGFFSHEDQLYAVYSINPYKVLRIDGNRAELVYEHYGLPGGGVKRGGASPVRYLGEFYSWYHTVVSRIYACELYTFEARPPFRPTRYVRRPMLWPKAKHQPVPTVPHCVYPAGAFQRDNRWHVSYGYYDYQSRVADFDINDVENALCPVPGGACDIVQDRAMGNHGAIVWAQVNLGNEYQLPESMNGATVIDVGGHIGSFTTACLERGAERVITCEPLERFRSCLAKNVETWKDKVTILPNLITGKADDSTGFQLLNGMVCVADTPSRIDGVGVLELGSILKGLESVDWLKLDCEGSEYSILCHTDLSKVKRIVGEAHRLTWDGSERTIEDVVQFLSSKGFRVRWEANGDVTWLFWAERNF